ncbi:MAG: S8 family serine peptidase, partial [Chitinophagaceae bacterium]|nr:S8 family serine peptidase [Chitinophagaceae bacterium]
MNTNLHGKLICCLVMLLALNTVQAQIKGNPRMKKTPSAQPAASKSFSPLSKDLISLYQSRNPRTMARTAKPVFQNNGLNKFIRITGDRVLLDVTVRGDEQKAKSDLQKLGFITSAVYGKIISGSLPINTLPQLETSASLKFARPAYKPLRVSQPFHDQTTSGHNSKPSPVISQGDTAQRSFIARKKYHVDGKGVKVGVMSDSYNSLGGAAKGVSGGELPGPGNPFNYKKPVQIIKDDSSGTDEGRAMAEIVHDVAPGAELAFSTANGGQAAFAQNIVNLSNVGCKVITDDVIYFAEPFFQDGIIAQAVDRVKKRGVSYFSAAGNTSVRSYESAYRPTKFAPFGPDAGTAHNFSGAGDPPRYFQPIFIPSGSTFITSFQWDQPFYSASNGEDSATTDFDIYLLNDTGAIVAAGGSDNLASGDPIELFGYQNTDTVNQTFYLAILKFTGPDVSRLKYIFYGDGAFYLTNPSIPGILAPALVGHAKADGAIATGAAFYLQTPAYGTDTAVIESYSSVGGVANYFTASGQRISPLVRKKPEIVAPDGVNTSFFDPFGNGDISEDSDKYPNFFGTSAAAPHA